MRNINKVMLCGNLTRSPELRHTPSGLAVLNIGIAVNDSRKNPSTGQWEEYPNYIDCTMMGERAEKLSGMLAKGMKVCVEGKLHYSSWESKDGNKRSKLDVTVDSLEFMSRKENPSGEDYGEQAAIEAAGPSANDAGFYASENIPF